MFKAKSHTMSHLFNGVAAYLVSDDADESITVVYDTMGVQPVDDVTGTLKVMIKKTGEPLDVSEYLISASDADLPLDNFFDIFGRAFHQMVKHSVMGHVYEEMPEYGTPKEFIKGVVDKYRRSNFIPF